MDRDEHLRSAKDVAGCWCTAGLLLADRVCFLGTGPGCVVPKKDEDDTIEYYTAVCGLCFGGDGAAAGALPAFWACHQIYQREVEEPKTDEPQLLEPGQRRRSKPPLGWKPVDEESSGMCMSVIKSIAWWSGATEDETTAKLGKRCIVQRCKCSSCNVPIHCSCKLL
jgi:hypothetical protein